MFKSSQTRTAVTFNVPSGVNVTFWPKRIYDGIYDVERIALYEVGYFGIRDPQQSDNFRRKNFAGCALRAANRIVSQRSLGNARRENFRIIIVNAIMRIRIARNEENVFPLRGLS